MATENNMGPGQQNAPEDGKIVYRADRSEGGEIIAGARQENQLLKQQKNAFNDPSEQHVGASPSKDTLSQQDITDGVKTLTNFKRTQSPRNHRRKNNGDLPIPYEGQKKQSSIKNK
jgi:hypothetical protein